MSYKLSQTQKIPLLYYTCKEKIAIKHTTELSSITPLICLHVCDRKKQQHWLSLDNDTNKSFWFLLIKLPTINGLFMRKTRSPYRRYPSPVRGWPLPEHRCNVTGHWIITKTNTGPAQAAAPNVSCKIQIRHSYLIRQQTVFSITIKSETVLNKTLHQVSYTLNHQHKKYK